jgi:LacI family transcriptional regulator
LTLLRQLAGSLGLSPTTVSRALAGYPDVSASTRARVEAAAAAAGYRPNPTAQRLRKKTTDTVAFLMTRAEDQPYEPLFVDLLTAVADRLAREGLDLVLVTPPEGDEVAACRRIAEERRADGVVVVRTRRVDPRVRFLSERGVPFVSFGRTEERAPHAFVDTDGELAFYEATLALARMGHRRIAHISADQGYTFAHLRASGWRTAMAELGLSAALAADGAPTARTGHRLAAGLLAAPGDAPTALLCTSDRMALGAMRAVREAGLMPGRDVAVVGHDDLPTSAYADPPLASMSFDLGGVGRRLAEALVARMGGAPAEDLCEVWPVRHVWRASAGPPARG